MKALDVCADLPNMAGKETSLHSGVDPVGLLRHVNLRQKKSGGILDKIKKGNTYNSIDWGHWDRGHGQDGGEEWEKTRMLDRMKQDGEGRWMTGGAIYNGGNPKPSTLKRLPGRRGSKGRRGMHSPSMHSPSLHSRAQ